MNFFRQQLEEAINDLLRSELTVFLDYEKWQYKGYDSGNSRNVLLFVSDGLVGLKEALTDIYPKAKHQICWRHLMRNIENKIRAKDKQEVANDPKLIYRSDDIETAEERLTEFLSK